MIKKRAPDNKVRVFYYLLYTVHCQLSSRRAISRSITIALFLDKIMSSHTMNI